MLFLSPVTYVLEAPVIENQRFPGHNYLLAIQVPEIAEKAVPGQFVMAAEVGNEPLPYPFLKRALAIYSIKERSGRKAVITLLLKIVGEGTRRLATLQEGDSVSLIGPLGNGFDLQRARGRISFLLAGGIGIASFYLLAERLKKWGEEVHLIFGGRSTSDLVGLEDFRQLGIPVFVTTDDGSLGLKGLITDGLKQYMRDFQQHRLTFYTCGPNPMMQAVSSIAHSFRIPCQLSVEARMACGFGVCLGCSVKTVHSYRLTCRQGPVFEADELVWEEE